MVTINPEKPIVNIPQRGKVENCNKGQKGRFDAIFRKTVDSTTIQNPKTESTHFVSDVRPAQFMSEPSPSSNRVVNQVQRLIDTMERYRQKLIDNSATLKDIQTLVHRMASESESLSAISGAMEEQDGLKTIMNQALMLSSMEIAKFNSGDYNDS